MRSRLFAVPGSAEGVAAVAEAFEDLDYVLRAKVLLCLFWDLVEEYGLVDGLVWS